MPRPAKRQAAGLAREQQIEEAAISVFSRKGYAAATLQDIADAVGILKGSLFHYISSKESLLYRILIQAHEEALQLMKELDNLDLPPDEHLREFAIRLAHLYLGNRERTILYFTEWKHVTGENLEQVSEHRRQFEAYLRQIITRCQKAALAPEGMNIRVATLYVLSAINGVVDWQPVLGRLSASGIASEVADLTCSTVLAAAPHRR